MTRNAGKAIMLLGSKGGVGTTTVVSLLAAQLGLRHRVTVADLQVGRCGNAAAYLGVKTHLQGSDSVWTQGDVSADEVRLALVRSHNIRVLPAADPSTTTTLSPKQIVRILSLLQNDCEYLVIDWGGPCDERMKATAQLSDYVVTVSTTDVAAVADLCCWVNMLNQWIEPSKHLCCLNQVQEEMKVSAVAEILGSRPIAILPKDRRIAVLLQEGNPITGKVSFKNHMLPLVQVLEKTRSGSDRTRRRASKASTPAQGDNHPSKWVDGARRNLRSRLINQLTEAMISESKGEVSHWQEGKRDKVRRLALELMNADHTFRTLAETVRHQIAEEIADEIVGLGPLQKHLDNTEVTEIIVNGPREVYVEINGKLVPTKDSFSTDEAVVRVVERIVSPLGRRIDESSPMVDARLPDGSRVNAVLPPVSLQGPMLNIRKFSKRPLRMDDLVRLGTVTEDIAEYLRLSVVSKRNIIISGGTGSGKTTLLNALSAFIPGNERIITIEDAAELRLQQTHVARLEARPPNAEGTGAISIRNLVRNALRMRPDRIIVGEVRGGEALDMLQAMNTGHNGSMATAHSNSPQDLLSRLETMILMGEIDLPIRAIAKQIAGSIDLIVHLTRLSDGSRRVTEVCEVQGLRNTEVVLEQVYVLGQDDFARDANSIDLSRLTLSMEEKLGVAL